MRTCGGSWSLRLVVLTLAGAVLASCAPARESTVAAPGGSSAPPEPRAAIRLDKPLRIGLNQEPAALGSKFTGGGTGIADYAFLFAAKMVHYDQLGNPVPVLVQEIPSLEKGTWKLLPDGRMETIYKLKPNLTWHDGTPFTPEDVVFTWSAIMSPELPAENREPEKFIDAIDVLDNLTLLVHWQESNIFANAWDLEPLPRHLLQQARNDPQAFTNAAYWSRDYVGLGPYRLTEWVQGSYLRGQAFPGFSLGSPKTNEIVVHFIADANQAVARMLAGAIDVTLGNLLRIDEGIILKEQMEARGEATVMTIPTKHRYGEFQYRQPQPPPSRDVRVRQAMVHGLDRHLLVEALLRGFTTPADMYLAPNDAAFPAADRAIRKYPFDTNRALALLSEAGWTRGPDGILRSASGERFDLEVRTTEETQNQKEVQILADAWRQIGINTQVEIIPRARQNDQEYRAKFPGISTSSTSIAPDWLDKWQTDRAASEANRWRGGNRGAYSSAEFDRLYRTYITTIDPVQRIDALVRAVKFASEDVTYLPLFYQVDVHAIRTGLKGLVPRWPGQSGMSFNAHEWYWE